jgi:hypothetical protein
MEKRGTPVTRIAGGDVAATAAATAAAAAGAYAEGNEGGPGDTDLPDTIDGISDEQAIRIRNAVRAAKRRKRE